VNHFEYYWLHTVHTSIKLFPMAAWLYRRKNSAHWWIGYRANGKQFLRSTKTNDRKKAEVEAAKVDSMFQAHKAGMLEEVYQALSGKVLPRITLRAAVEEWLSEVKSERGDEGTFARYEDIANGFVKFIGATEQKPLLSEISTEQIRTYLDHRRKRCSPSTTNLERKVLSVFFRRTMKNEQLKINPVFPIRPYKGTEEETVKRRAFTLAELRLLYRKAPDDFWRYMITGGFYAGLRMGDLICLTWSSIDLVDNLISKKTQKTKKTVHIPIAAPFRAILTERYRRAGKPRSGYVWPEQAHRYQEKGSGQFSNEFYDSVLAPCGFVAVRESKRGSGKGRQNERQLNPVSFHSFRHSFVSLLKATGGSQVVAKELAGHSSDLISDVYTTLPKEVLTAAIDNLPRLEVAD
jgi:integrase